MDEAAPKLGIKDSLEAKAFLVDLTKAVLEAKNNNGKFDAADLSLLLGPAMKLPAALDGVGNIFPELKDLDSVEAGELLGSVAADLGLESEKVKVYVEEGLKVVVSLIKIIRA